MRHTQPFSPSVKRMTLCTLAALTLLSACGDKDAAPAAGAAPGARPPPEVGVIVAKFQPVALQTELPGRVEPVRVAQVRARVNGVVLKREFTEGSEVKAGQVLFRIDPAPYQAALNSARAPGPRALARRGPAVRSAARPAGIWRR